MSYERGWKALSLDMPDTIPHTEYCSHPLLVKAVTGIDPRDDASAWGMFYRATNYDFLWSSNDGPGWKGRTTSIFLPKGASSATRPAVFSSDGMR